MRENSAVTLYRLLSLLTLEGTPDRMIFLAEYAQKSSSFEAAELLARRRDLQVAVAAALVPEDPYLVSHEWRVVWYRTLTDEELDVIR